MILNAKFKQPKVVLLLACLLFAFIACNNSNDFSKDKPVNDSIDFYLQRSGNFDLSESERWLAAKNAYRLINNQTTDSLNFVNRYYVAFRFYNLNRLEDYRDIVNSTLNIAIKKNDRLNMARSFSYLGDYYYDINLIDSAYFNYNQAKKLFFNLKNNRLIGLMYLKKANTQIKANDYFGSEKSAVTALNYIRVDGNKNYEYDAYNILGLNCLQRSRLNFYFIKFF
jgi:hypothetical protein